MQLNDGRAATQIGTQLIAEPSIYHAQATEIQDSAIAARPTFSFDKLKSWRDEALQVLKSIHLLPTRAYETTLFPDNDLTAKIRWDRIKMNK